MTYGYMDRFFPVYFLTYLCSLCDFIRILSDSACFLQAGRLLRSRLRQTGPNYIFSHKKGQDNHMAALSACNFLMRIILPPCRG